VLPILEELTVEPETDEQDAVAWVSQKVVTSDRRVVHVRLRIGFKAIDSSVISDATDFVARQATAHLQVVIGSMTLVDARQDHSRIQDEMSTALEQLTRGVARSIAVDVRATDPDRTEFDPRVRSYVYSRDGRTFRSTLPADEVARRREDAARDSFVKLEVIVPSAYGWAESVLHCEPGWITGVEAIPDA
jgi:hypothetical protein